MDPLKLIIRPIPKGSYQEWRHSYEERHRRILKPGELLASQGAYSYALDHCKPSSEPIPTPSPTPWEVAMEKEQYGRRAEDQSPWLTTAMTVSGLFIFGIVIGFCIAKLV